MYKGNYKLLAIWSRAWKEKGLENQRQRCLEQRHMNIWEYALNVKTFFILYINAQKKASTMEEALKRINKTQPVIISQILSWTTLEIVQQTHEQSDQGGKDGGYIQA